MGKHTEPLVQQYSLTKLVTGLRTRSLRRRKERRIAAMGSLVLGLGLLVVPKPEELPTWLTVLFVIAVLLFTVSLGWLCRSLNEDVGFGASARTAVFVEFLAGMLECDTAEAVRLGLDVWPTLSQTQRDAFVPHLTGMLGRLDTIEAAQLTNAQRCALEEIIQSYRHTDVAILGLLTLASAEHSGSQLRPLVESWADQPGRRGAAALEYLSALESRR
ncbi:MAG: hypothetical protein QM758_26335 [Armatimonas sp.]